jgi:hypothetical protein
MYLKNLNFFLKGTTHPLDSSFNSILNKTQIVESSSNGVIPTKG